MSDRRMDAGVDFGTDLAGDLAPSSVCPPGQGAVQLATGLANWDTSLIVYGQSVLVASAGKVLAVDRATGQTSVVAPVWAGRMALDGNQLYMIVAGGTITQLDLPSGQMTALIKREHALDIAAVGGAVFWVETDPSAYTLWRWQNGVVTSLGAGCYVQTVRDEVWATSGDNCGTVTGYRPSDDSVFPIVTAKSGVTAIVADAKQAYFAFNERGPNMPDFRILDFIPETFVDISDGASYAFQMAIDDGAVYFVGSNLSPTLWSIDRQGQNVQAMAQGESTMSAVAADGECVYYLTQGNDGPSSLYRVPRR